MLQPFSRQEIEKFRGKIQSKGLSFVPLDLYINNNGLIKLTVAIAKGKKLHDKRESIKRKETIREL